MYRPALQELGKWQDSGSGGEAWGTGVANTTLLMFLHHTPERSKKV